MIATTKDRAVMLAVRGWMEQLDSQWCRDNGDVGMYYAPRLERGTIIHAGCDDGSGNFARVIWPNSKITVYNHCVEIDGRRGSVEDVIVPVLDSLGHHPKDRPHIWSVVTTRSDVPWWTRCTDDNAIAADSPNTYRIKDPLHISKRFAELLRRTWGESAETSAAVARAIVQAVPCEYACGQERITRVEDAVLWMAACCDNIDACVSDDGRVSLTGVPS